MEFWTGAMGITKMRLMPSSLAAGYDVFVEDAKAAEALGFHAYGAPEHHFTYDAFLPFPLQALAAAASATSSIKLVTGAMLMTLYDPLAAAEHAATLDVLSGGRVILGSGHGLPAHGVRRHRHRQAHPGGTPGGSHGGGASRHRRRTPSPTRDATTTTTTSPCSRPRCSGPWPCGSAAAPPRRPPAGPARPGLPYWLANAPYERTEEIVHTYRRIGREAGWPEEQLRVAAFKDVFIGSDRGRGRGPAPDDDRHVLRRAHPGLRLPGRRRRATTSTTPARTTRCTASSSTASSAGPSTWSSRSCAATRTSASRPSSCPPPNASCWPAKSCPTSPEPRRTDGPALQPRGRGVPPAPAGLAGRAPAVGPRWRWWRRCRHGRHRAVHPGRPRLAAVAVGGGLRGPELAPRLRRPGRHPHPAGDRHPGAGPRVGPAADQHDRADHPGPHAHRARHRGPAPALPAPHPGRRGPLVPGIQRTRRRLATWPASRPEPCSTATTSWSPARRCGRRWHPSPTGASCWSAPTPTPPSARASPTCSATCAPRASRWCRCATPVAASTSARCSSTRCASPPTSSWASCTAAGPSPAPPSSTSAAGCPGCCPWSRASTGCARTAARYPAGEGAALDDLGSAPRARPALDRGRGPALPGLPHPVGPARRTRPGIVGVAGQAVRLRSPPALARTALEVTGPLAQVAKRLTPHRRPGPLAGRLLRQHRPQHRRRHRRDDAQRHRRADPGPPPPGAGLEGGTCMDFELSEEQMALRDAARDLIAQPLGHRPPAPGPGPAARPACPARLWAELVALGWVGIAVGRRPGRQRRRPAHRRGAGRGGRPRPAARSLPVGAGRRRAWWTAWATPPRDELVARPAAPGPGGRPAPGRNPAAPGVRPGRAPPVTTMAPTPGAASGGGRRPAGRRAPRSWSPTPRVPTCSWSRRSRRRPTVLVAVPAGEGVEIEAMRRVDGQDMAEVRFDVDRAGRRACWPPGPRPCPRAYDLGTLLAAADLLGVAAAALEATVDLRRPAGAVRSSPSARSRPSPTSWPTWPSRSRSPAAWSWPRPWPPTTRGPRRGAGADLGGQGLGVADRGGGMRDGAARARRDRLHLGARRAPVAAPGPGRRGQLRRRHPPPGPHRRPGSCA